MKKKLKVLFGLATSWMLAPAAVLAEGNPAIKKLNEIGAEKGPYIMDTGTGLAQVVGVAIQAVLGIIGAVFLALMLYAGFNWMIARGEEEKVEKAKDTITRAIIGIIIVVGSYAIWTYVFQYLF